jgi:hypothetical protein
MPRTTGSFDLAFGAPEARLRIAIRRPIYTFPRISAVFPRKSSRYEAPPMAPPPDAARFQSPSRLHR